MFSVRRSLVSWWVDRRVVLVASMKGGFQNTNDFLPLGAPSFEMISKSFPVNLLACCSGLAIVADERMIFGSAW